MSRIAGPRVDPIELDGKRDAQIINGPNQGLAQRTADLSVADIATGRRIPALLAYPVDFDPEMEADVQHVFFTHMTLDEPNRRLAAESEHKQLVFIAIDDHSVTPAP